MHILSLIELCFSLHLSDFVFFSHCNRMNVSATLKGGQFLWCFSVNRLLKPAVLLPISALQPPRQISSSKFPDTEKALTSRLTGKKTKLWELYNEVVYPPRDSSRFVIADDNFLEARPAEVTYTKENILYSRKKLWLLAFMVDFYYAAFNYF